MASNVTATPLLAAFRARARKVSEKETSATGFQIFLTVMGCLLPISVCWYQAVAEPLFAVGTVEFTHPDLIAALILVVAGGRALVKGFGRLPRYLVITSLLFLVSTVLSALVAKDTLRGFAAVIQDLEFLALMWAFSFMTDARHFLRIVHFTLAVFVFQTVVAAAQFLAGDSMLPTGTFFSHQQYAFFISVGASVAFALFASERARWKKFLYFITLSILVVGSLLGQERAPWLAFVISGVVVIAYSGKKKKAILVGLLVTVLTAILLVVCVPGLRELTISRIAEAETQSESQNSVLSRLLLWGIGLKLFAENPIFGIGPKNFVTVVPQYATPDEMMGSEALDPHNAWIEYLAEQGIVGFITYTAFCWAIVKLGTNLLRENLNNLAGSLCLAYLAYNVFWLVMLIPYFIKGMGHIHFMMIGLTIGLGRGLASGPRPAPLPASLLQEG